MSVTSTTTNSSTDHGNKQDPINRLEEDDKLKSAEVRYQPPPSTPYAEWSKGQLCVELKQRGLPSSGNKSDLIKKLEQEDDKMKKAPRGARTTVWRLGYEEASSHDQKIIILSGKSSSYDWGNGGFNMEVPDDCLPEGVTECTLQVTASLGTDILLPENTTLVSAVYHIIMLVKQFKKLFKKPVRIIIEHCADLKPGEEDKLSFVVAKEGATQFELLPGGHFSSTHPYGSIEIDSFSFFAIVSEMWHGSTYYGCVYYTRIEPNSSHEIHIVIIKKLSLAHQIVSEEYQNRMHCQKPFKFTSPQNRIVLQRPANYSPEDGWNFTYIVPEVNKDEVDSFVHGLPVPRFQLHVRKTSPDAEPKDYTVNVLETQEETCFVLLCPPPAALPPVNNGPPPAALPPVNNGPPPAAHNENLHLQLGFISLGATLCGIIMHPSLLESVLPKKWQLPMRRLLRMRWQSRLKLALVLMTGICCSYCFIQASDRIRGIIPLIQPILNTLLNLL